MTTLLSTIYKTIGFKNIILAALIIAALGSFAYQNKKYLHKVKQSHH